MYGAYFLPDNRRDDESIALFLIFCYFEVPGLETCKD
tara:strand:+ start:402 stop:512 length:111 start_codon:yes stop_codon:yes gene_type:complete